MATLDSKNRVDDLELNLLAKTTDQLSDVEALAGLMPSHDRSAVLVGDIFAVLLLRRVADLVGVGLASVDVDGLLVRGTSC